MNDLWGSATSVGVSWVSRISNWSLGSSSSTVAQKASCTKLRIAPSFMWETRRWKTSWSVFWIAQSSAENAESADLATGSSLRKTFDEKSSTTWYWKNILILVKLVSEAPLKRKLFNKNALGHTAVTPTVAELHELTNLSSLFVLLNSIYQRTH